MAAFCIPESLAQELKAAASRGEINIGQMYEMTSSERRSLFEKYVDRDTAQAINLGFEKAMISTQQTALKKWAQEVFVGKKNAVAKKGVLKKINELQESGILDPKSEKAFLEDLVTQKLGVTVTVEEAQQISKLSDALSKASENQSEFGTPSIEYFEARREMEDYLNSIEPSSNLKVATSVIARGNLLFRVSSPLLNIESNSIMGGLQAFARRMEAREVGGVNNGYAYRYAKFANKVYAKTGYDVTRMMSLDSERTLKGEERVTSEGPGAVRKVGRFYEDKIFSLTQGAPDVLFSSLSFSDRANIESTKLARHEKLKGNKLRARALEIFKDATRIDPITPQGKAVRDSALADAMYSTYTNKSVYADVALGIRKVFNIASGDLRLGDQIMPFVKTPANVIGSGLNMSGIGLPLDVSARLVRTLNDIRQGQGFTEASRSEFQGFTRTIVQSGLGLTFAFILSTLFEPEDFIGEFPVSEKERQLLALRNAPTNSVRIGDKWVSLDYFGPLGASLTGLLYAKKFGNTLPEQAYNYAKGVIRQSARFPGFDEAYSTLKSIQEATPQAGKTVGDELKSIANFMVGFVQPRTIPGFVSVLAAMTDPVQRASSKNILDKLKLAIPGMRQTLPEKKTIFGETMESEPWYSTLFAGSRVKTAQDNKLIQEFLNLDASGNLPSITDVSKTSPRAKALKDQIGEEKFSEAMTLFGTKFKEKVEKLIDTPAYQKAPDERKANAINKIKNDLFEAVLKKYGYKKTSETPEGSPMASLVESANKFLSSIVPTVSAAEGKTITSIEVKGDRVITYFEDENGNPGVKSESIDSGQTALEAIGGIFDRVGRTLKLPELNLSETLGYKTREEKIKALMDYNNVIQGKPKEEADLGPGHEPMLQPKGPIPEAKVSEEVKSPQKEVPKETGGQTYGRNPAFYKKTGSSYKVAENVDSAIRSAAEKFGVPHEFLFDVAAQESSLNPSLVNETPEGKAAGNPTGLYQFTDSTWKDVLAYNNSPKSSLYKVLPNTDRTDPRTNALAAAYLIKNGQLGKWDASEDVWGEFWSPDELERMGFYKQSRYHIPGKRASARLRGE